MKRFVVLLHASMLSITLLPSSVLTSVWIDDGSGILYSFEKTPVTWFEAVGKCAVKGINGRLATLDHSSTVSSLQPYAKRAGGSYWIGLYKSPSGTFQRVGDTQISFFDWAYGEPNAYLQTKEDCVELVVFCMKWNDAVCDSKKPYLCASDKPNSSASDKSKAPTADSIVSKSAITTTDSRSNWIDIGSNVLYYTDNTLATWSEAREKCTKKGINGRLATLDSEAVSLSLRPYIKNAGGKIWIGIYKDSSGTFRRIGTVQSNFFNWAPGEPNDHLQGNEDCVEILVDSFKWNDVPCNLKKQVLCVSDKANSTISASAMAAIVASAPSPTITVASPSSGKLVSETDKASVDKSRAFTTDVAKECHVIVIIVSFIIVFVFSVFLGTVVFKRWFVTTKTCSSVHKMSLLQEDHQ